MICIYRWQCGDYSATFGVVLTFWQKLQLKGKPMPKAAEFRALIRLICDNIRENLTRQAKKEYLDNLNKRDSGDDPNDCMITSMILPPRPPPRPGSKSSVAAGASSAQHIASGKLLPIISFPFIPDIFIASPLAETRLDAVGASQLPQSPLW